MPHDTQTLERKSMQANNNFYGLEDFVETMNGLSIKRADIKSVIKAWGDTNGSSKEESGSELEFGVVIELNDGRFAYATGWNDYTGWGCQDGVEIKYANSLDKLDLPTKREYYEGELVWDEKPTDLNEWVQGNRKTFYDRED